MGRCKALLLAVAMVVGIAAMTMPATDADASAARHVLTSTARIVLRPVTASGRPAPGYARWVEHGSGVDCSFSQASPAAVDPNISDCSPDSEYAIACWRAAAPHRVLCLRDARVKQLASIYRDGPMATATPYKVRAPLDLLLGNGKYCTIRDGGAGSSLQGHPKWAAYYYCHGGVAVWAPMSARNWGVDRSHAVWTVKVGREDGSGGLITRKVARAWFVGTHA
jgi:hypothetical protein